MAQTLNTPQVLNQPIANNGDKNVIPNTNDQSTGLMSMSAGFPPVTSQRIADGGIPPRRSDVNGALNLISQQHYFLQNGGTYTFRQDVSDAIGGYPKNSILYYEDPDGNLTLVRSLIENNTGNFINNPSLIDGVNWERLSLGIANANIGQIIQMVCASDYTPFGTLPCDGSQYSSQQFPTLWQNYLTGENPLLNICTVDEWDNEVASNGQCLKFAVDTVNNVFKVPLVKDGTHLQQALSDSELSKYYEDGLPILPLSQAGVHTHTRGTMNITGGPLHVSAWSQGTETKGALSAVAGGTSHNDTGGTGWDLYLDAQNGWTGATSSGGEHTHTFNSSKVGKYNNVQPVSFGVRFFIVVANAVRNESMMDWSEWQSSLDGKANKDFSNITQDGINLLSGILGLSVGDIGLSGLGIDESKNKRRYLNGQIISQTQFQIFTAVLKQRIALAPTLACTEEEWQSEVSLSKLGQCGKFVIDDTAGTIRLPKVVNINGLQDLSLMGSIKNESLPNHMHYVSRSADISNESVTNENGGSSDTVSLNASLNTSYLAPTTYASYNNSTYQDNAPVQQEAVQYPYFIQVATGAETSADITTEIQLNNPFSLLDYKWSEYAIDNASWLISNGAYHSGAVYPSVFELLTKILAGTVTKEGVSVKLHTEAYTDYDFVINNNSNTFRLPVKMLLASGNRVAGNGMTLGLTDGTTNYGTTAYTRSTGTSLSAISTSYGQDVGYVTATGTLSPVNTSIGITLDPTKSGIETSSQDLYLYFYVGETVQDANIIATSNALTEIANLKGYAIGRPDYSAGVAVSQSSGNTYTVPQNGYIKCKLGYSGSNAVRFTDTNSSGVEMLYVWTQNNQASTSYLPVSKNQIIYFFERTGTVTVVFYPSKGG